MSQARPQFPCIIEAWGEHEAELRGYLRRRLGGDHDSAEDLLQDTFLRALKQGSRFCAIEQPRAWLFQVARNRFSDHLRRARLRQTDPLNEDSAEIIEDGSAEPVAAVASLDSCLPQALAALSESDRHILQLCDLEGVRQVDYAASHQLGLSTVKSRIQRARKRLKAKLDSLCGVRYDDSGQVCCHHCPPDQGSSD